MRNYVIITESTSDITKELVEELGVIVIPMNFEMNQKSYTHYPDGREMGVHEFYEALKAGSKSVTSLVNTQTFLNYFEPVIKEGNDILYIGFSSGLSGTYNSAVIASEELLEKYPDARISCIDTKAASALLDHMVETSTNPEEQVIFIGHGDAMEDAEFLAEQIKEKLHVKDVILTPIGPVVGSHSGPGTIALFFFGTKR